MTYIYHLAGENIDLSKEELKGFLRSQDIKETVEMKDRICLSSSHPSQLKRLGMVHQVSELIDRRKDLKTNYRPESSFAVRTTDLTGEADTEKMEEKLGKYLTTEENEVELENPEEVINLYIFEDEYFVSRRILDIDRGLFKARKNQERPFSSPVSLDPVLARVMVNLSEVSAGGKILDPFCGTGGILIEAGLCGILPCGADIQEEMVSGARENLENYGILNHDIKHSDIKNIEENFENEFEGVITDLPYGQSSKKEGKPVVKFLEKIDNLNKGKTVFMYNEPEVNSIEADFEIYVHKNLTRYIYVV